MSMLATALLMLTMQAAPLQGVVYKKGTNQPLSDATVELRQDQENATVLKTMTTEDDGRFLFDNVAPGRYRVTVSRRGYTRPPLTIAVAARQATEIQLPMTPAGTISGHVYDANGQPLGNIEVLAMKATYPDGRRKLTPVQSATTNDLGEYRLFWLAPGRYYVSAVHPKAQGMMRQMMLGFGISASGMSIGSMINTTTKSDPAYAGIDPEDQSERYAPIFFGGTTDEQSATPVDIRPGTEVGGASIMVGPVRPRHVRGIVIDGLTGKPAQYASLSMPTDSDGPRGKEFEVDRERSTFDLLLLPGSHTLNATSASGEGSVTFQLFDVDIENLAIPTTPTFEITGRISVEGEPNSGAALGSLRMTLRHDPPREEPSSTLMGYSSPLPNGSFVLSASAGDYRVNIAPLLNVASLRLPATLPPALQIAYVKSIRLGNVDVLNGVLHLEGKPSMPLEIVVGKNSGAIDGQVVTNPQGSAADISVVLVPDVRRRSELYRSTTTDVSGRFQFDRVPPGDYKIFSWEEVQDGAWYDPEFLRTVENRGTPIRIVEGRTENARVEAIP
jgi:5-hydroxyisourate hydrolase-like protein (transthyretin family)